MPEHKSCSLSLQEIAEALRPFDAHLSDEQLAAVGKYVDLLLLWNDRLSLTAVTGPAEIVSRHFGESIFAGNFVDFSHGRLADLGTGAGFPGLALKIAFPELKVSLVESNFKKCAFLREVSAELGLQGVEIVRSRYEDLPASDKKVDFVGSRALGGYKELLNWSREALKPSGRVVLWMGEEDAAKAGNIAGWRWEAPVRIPGSERRVIAVGRPMGGL